MILLLKTGIPSVVLLGKNGEAIDEEAGRDEQGYLPAVKTLFERQEKASKDLDGIFVEQGSGSFSRTRSAVVFANMLLLSHGLPLATLSSDDEKAGLSYKHLLKRLRKEALRPLYYAEPNIT